MTKKTPRGIRNNNPGNIRWGSPWQGLVPTGQRTDPDFCQFKGVAWGIRAIARILIAYADDHDLHTVQSIIDRWAPPAENNTKAYVNAICTALHVSPKATIDVHSYPVMLALVKAIIEHENGEQPYDATILEQGLKLAGVVRPTKTAVHTATGAAVATGTVTGAVAAVVAGYQQIAPLYHVLAGADAGWLRTVGGALVVASIAASIYAYWRHRKEIAAVQP